MKENKLIIQFLKKTPKLNIYKILYDGDTAGDFELVQTIENIHLLNENPFALQGSNPINSISIVVNQKLFNELINVNEKDTYDHTILLKGKDYTSLTKYLDDLEKKEEGLTIYKYNLQEELKLMNNLVLVIKILLYGFISLVTLIGVTSVLNTINTSIALRRKEFAMLRSMGLTPKGFNKILFFESLFFGLKSLLYALPVSIVITVLLHLSFNDLVNYKNLILPYDSIIISIFGVFVIVLISMWYASSKIKKENILEAIREENI